MSSEMSSEEGNFFEILEAWTCEYCSHRNGHTEWCAICGQLAIQDEDANDFINLGRSSELSNMSSNDADSLSDDLNRLLKKNQDDSSETAGRPVKGGNTVPSDSPTEVTNDSNSFDSPPTGEAYAQDTNSPTEVTIDSQTPVAADNSPSTVTNDSQPNKPFQITKAELEKAKKEAKEKKNVILLGFGNISQKHYNEFLDKYTKPWKEAKAKNKCTQVLKDIHQELDKYTVIVKKMKSDEIWVYPVGCERGPMVNDRVISSLDTKVKKRGGSTTSSRGQFKKTKKAPSLKQSNDKLWWMWIPGSGWIPIPDGACGKVAGVWERVQRDYRRCQIESQLFVPFPYEKHNHNITKPGKYEEEGFQLQFFEACLSNPHRMRPCGVLSSTQGPVFISEIYYGGEAPETVMTQIFGSNQNHDNRKNPPDNHNGGGHSRDTSHGGATQTGSTNTGDANILGQSDATEENRYGGDHFTHACDLSSLSDTSLESSASSCAGLDELLAHIISDLDARIDCEIEKEESAFDQKSSTHSKDSSVPVRGNDRRRLDTGPIASVAKKTRLDGNEPKEQQTPLGRSEYVCDKVNKIGDESDWESVDDVESKCSSQVLVEKLPGFQPNSQKKIERQASVESTPAASRASTITSKNWSDDPKPPTPSKAALGPAAPAKAPLARTKMKQSEHETAEESVWSLESLDESWASRSSPFEHVANDETVKELNNFALETEAHYQQKLMIHSEEDIVIKKVTWSDVSIESVLGEGAFSFVFKVKLDGWKEEGEDSEAPEMALKCLKAKAINQEDDFVYNAMDIFVEGQLLSRLSHPNIIHMAGCAALSLGDSYRSSDGFFLLLDQIEYTLMDRLNEWRNEVDECNQFRKEMLSKDGVYKRLFEIGLPVASAIEYLHERRIVLRDLKPENIGFDAKTKKVKLFDFGLSRDLDTVPKDDIAGSIAYMAPEILLMRGTGLYSDVYSFSIVTWELCTLDLPLAGFSTVDQVKQKVAKNHWRPSLNPIPFKDLRKTLQDGWSKKEEERPSMAEMSKLIQDCCFAHAMGGGNKTGPLGKPRRMFSAPGGNRVNSDDTQKPGVPSQDLAALKAEKGRLHQML